MWITNNIRLITLITYVFLVISCSNNNMNESALKQDIINTEKAFEKMANDKGIAEAFNYFADQNAVILRNNNLIKGKNNIYHSIKTNDSYKHATLQWDPDFVEVSKDGTLAYTYGEYIFEYYDKNNTKQTSTGIYHTVWKKQEDGSWKYVWD